VPTEPTDRNRRAPSAEAKDHEAERERYHVRNVEHILASVEYCMGTYDRGSILSSSCSRAPAKVHGELVACDCGRMYTWRAIHTRGELYLFDRQNPVHFVEADVAGNQERVGRFKRPQPRVSARVACE
jgi:hypothetical protein